ncbi:electron transfer flavoprotein subunit alpha/FixB family protein [Trinickia terrae]|uniref:Electron transfer flavoprotein subunit alpha/FixB family protein n=1 Tax=Trinickia terrae TaxID=2571161 RepID=A0A4V6WQ33_9BURK|nr:electron transfer flavoprotein subunit alpha/FixB family protein [Trinickia terrae]TKC81290.1 electron transfer flavoprotein subunit alpha/FixB family protein [Trinickia terrae]
MNTIKRIDPRRPFTITAIGLKRITLGVETVAGATADFVPKAAHGAGVKPRRALDGVERVVLAVVYGDRGSLDEHARQAVAAAALIADAHTQVALLVFGELKEDAAALGADKVIELPSIERRAFAPERALRALAACASSMAPAHIVMPDGVAGDGDLGRRYAALTGASFATQVVEIDATHVGVYANAKKSFATRPLPDVILLAPNAVDPKLPFVGAGERVRLDSLETIGAEGAAYRDLGIEEIDAAQVALEEADFIVSAGNGVSDVAAFETLAGVFGAAIGASRVAVDNGDFTRDKQVGATGKTVDASVYIAFGISGAVQHLQGIKDCRHVIAVNLDGSAPIVKRANLSVIGDAQTTIAALIEEVRRARKAHAAKAGASDAASASSAREGVAA